MRIMVFGAAACVAAGVAPSASAFDASIHIGVNKGQRIVVSAGDQFRVEALITYPGWPQYNAVQFAGVEGSIIVSRDAGTPNGSVTGFFQQGGLVNFGTYRGGSRVNIRIHQTPAFFSGGIPPYIPNNGGVLAGYSLSFQQAGKYEIAWIENPTVPAVRLFPSPSSPFYVLASTTYLTAEILVVACRPDLTTVLTPGLEGYGVPDGVADSHDFFYYLQQYQFGNAAVADMTTTATPGAAGYRVPDGLVTGDDYFYFLSEYAGGC